MHYIKIDVPLVYVMIIVNSTKRKRFFIYKDNLS